MNKNLIKSKDNNFFKKLKKITSSKKAREEFEGTLLDGAHLVMSYKGIEAPVALILDESIKSQEIDNLISSFKSVKCYTLTHELFMSLSELKSSSGIFALVKIPKLILSSGTLVLLLDSIQDPGNLGSILRTALATGVTNVVLSQGCADLWSPKTLRGSQGVQFKLDCLENQNLEKWIEKFDGDIVALSMGGELLYKAKLKKNIALILGNEGNGISPGLLKKATKVVSLPMSAQVESINVGAAGSAFMYEYYRQFILA
jgi:TrmH family RNA methyltransferase